MIEIIAGTNRPNSNTLKIAKYVEALYADTKEPARVLDLCQLNLADVADGEYTKGPKGTFASAVERVTSADGLVMVVPEYNGSYPGILKLFIDYWKFPESFEHRPVAFIGLGWRWAGLRPVEHLQGVFGYRNAYNFPVRVFLPNIGNTFKDGKITDPAVDELLKTQTREFSKFVRGLKSEGLHSVSRSLLPKT